MNMPATNAPDRRLTTSLADLMRQRPQATQRLLDAIFKVKRRNNRSKAKPAK